MMTVATISSKYQIVIPKDIREKLNLVPGQQVQLMALPGRIEIIPMKPIEQGRGFLRGIDTTVDRDPDRDL